MRLLMGISMLLALLSQGFWYWIRDGLTRILPWQFLASDVIWSVTLVSIIFLKWCPRVPLISSWLLFCASAFLLVPFAEIHNPLQFLIFNCMVIANLVFANIAYYFRRKVTR